MGGEDDASTSVHASTLGIPSTPLKPAAIKRRFPSIAANPPKRPAPKAVSKPEDRMAVVPVDCDAVKFQLTNPKRPGTAAHERYELYKRARTVKGALRLGAAKGDIAYDFSRGFLKYVG